MTEKNTSGTEAAFTTAAETIKIQGMICRACEEAVCFALLHTRGVISAQASYRRGEARVAYDPGLTDMEAIGSALERSGYPPGEGGLSGRAADAVCLALVAVLLWLSLRLPGGGADMQGTGSLWELFLTGLFTSVHCIGMCGGIALCQTTDASCVNAPRRRGAMASLAYNGGRVASYTLMGGAFGALGAVITYSVQAKSMVFTLAGIAVTLLGLGMSGALPALSALPSLCPRRLSAGKPLIVGFLTGLMPCGALYAMWLRAMGAGSFAAGAAVMLAFSLGTVPLLFLFGAASSFVPRRWMKYALKLSAVLVVTMGVKMLLKGLMLAGVF